MQAMQKGNYLFLAIVIIGIVLGIVLMTFNEPLFNQIIGKDQAPQPTISPTSSPK